MRKICMVIFCWFLMIPPVVASAEVKWDGYFWEVIPDDYRVVLVAGIKKGM